VHTRKNVPNAMLLPSFLAAFVFLACLKAAVCPQDPPTGANTHVLSGSPCAARNASHPDHAIIAVLCMEEEGSLKEIFVELDSILDFEAIESMLPLGRWEYETEERSKEDLHICLKDVVGFLIACKKARVSYKDVHDAAVQNMMQRHFGTNVEDYMKLCRGYIRFSELFLDTSTLWKGAASHFEEMAAMCSDPSYVSEDSLPLSADDFLGILKTCDYFALREDRLFLNSRKTELHLVTKKACFALNMIGAFRKMEEEEREQVFGCLRQCSRARELDILFLLTKWPIPFEIIWHWCWRVARRWFFSWDTLLQTQRAVNALQSNSHLFAYLYLSLCEKNGAELGPSISITTGPKDTIVARLFAPPHWQDPFELCAEAHRNKALVIDLGCSFFVSSCCHPLLRCMDNPQDEARPLESFLRLVLEHLPLLEEIYIKDGGWPRDEILVDAIIDREVEKQAQSPKAPSLKGLVLPDIGSLERVKERLCRLQLKKVGIWNIYASESEKYHERPDGGYNHVSENILGQSYIIGVVKQRKRRESRETFVSIKDFFEQGSELSKSAECFVCDMWLLGDPGLLDGLPNVRSLELHVPHYRWHAPFYFQRVEGNLAKREIDRVTILKDYNSCLLQESRLGRFQGSSLGNLVAFCGLGALVWHSCLFPTAFRLSAASSENPGREAEILSSTLEHLALKWILDQEADPARPYIVPNPRQGIHRIMRGLPCLKTLVLRISGGQYSEAAAPLHLLEVVEREIFEMEQLPLPCMVVLSWKIRGEILGRREWERAIQMYRDQRNSPGSWEQEPEFNAFLKERVWIETGPGKASAVDPEKEDAIIPAA
jgi:hypothetical protein